MRAYIIRRLITTIPVALGVVTLVFFIIHLTPGDPAQIMLGETAAAADISQLRANLGLDKPIPVQYLSFIKGVLTFDLGASIYTRKSVAESIFEVYPATISLALCSMALAITLAIPLGALAAYRKDTAIDRGAMLASLLGVSTPTFCAGPLLILVFAANLGWLPASGREGLASLALPSITLGMAMAAILSRLTRSTLIEALGEDYITAARARGASGFTVLFKHALSNALLPVVTVAGLQLGGLLAGTVITETIFAWPGLGRLTVEAINARDYPLAQGCVLTISLSYLLVNILVDMLYAAIDPRIRYQ
ncbi:MAG: ABC transporter permease [Nitrospinota bacterium]|nr:ABC transporter permease [Nitrospinota bacterium]